MVNIKNLLEFRATKALGQRESKWQDEWLDELMQQPAQQCAYLVSTDRLLQQPRLRASLAEKYFIRSIFSIGAVFVNTSLQFYLYALVNKQSSDIHMSVFEGNTYVKQHQIYKDHFLRLADNYTPAWIEYTSKLEKWINEGIMPKDDKDCEFFSVDLEEIDSKHLTPNYYSMENRMIREELQKKPAASLSSLAEVLRPRKLSESNETGRVIKAYNLVYPFDIDSIEYDTKTNIKLQNNDILLRSVGDSIKPYLLRYDGPEDLYPSQLLYVIRCGGRILPEYLYSFALTVG